LGTDRDKIAIQDINECEIFIQTGCKDFHMPVNTTHINKIKYDFPKAKMQ